MNESCLSLRGLDGGRKVHLRGANDASIAWWLVRIAREHAGPVVFVEEEQRRLEMIQANMQLFVGASGVRDLPVLGFPAWDVYPYSRLSPSSEVVGKRMSALQFLRGGERGVVLTSISATGTRIPSPERLNDAMIHLHEGMAMERDPFIGSLESLMYQRRSLVESPGEYAVRGGILDFFSPQNTYPTRLEFRGDELDSLRNFNPQTQRNLETLQSVDVFPSREIVFSPAELERGRRALSAITSPETSERVERLLEHLAADGHFGGMEGLAPMFLSDMTTLFDVAPGSALWILNDAERLDEWMEKLWDEVNEEARLAPERGLVSFTPEKLWLGPEEIREELSIWPRLEFDTLGLDSPNLEDGGEAGEALRAENINPFRGQVEAFVGQLRAWRGEGQSIVIVAEEKTLALRIQMLLREHEVGVEILPAGASLMDGHHDVVLAEGKLSAGFRLPREQRVFFRAQDLLVGALGRGSRRLPQSKPGEGFKDLSEDDLVVHAEHGVGRYMGTRVMEHRDGENEFLALQYAGGDKLYVPMDDVERIHKYRGAGVAPPLDRLGGNRWNKTKNNVKKSLRGIARDLVRLYSERSTAEGHAFSAEGAFDHEISGGFGFEETPDQEQAIRAVLGDMERARPMDRLICGDVGYGKTEVALRAAARAISAGKQVAVIVPTTLLAHQHWETFRKRFESLPVHVEMLSRFRTRKEQNEVMEGLSSGRVDIVIGTHRLLQKDVSFRDLGLLVIDEEHRFGVSHKEKLKKLRFNVDVLALTATPIPRTLQMALSGARDLSVIETPPRHRVAPRTYISRFSEKLIKDAITKEIDRGGQVFFVHNRVQSLLAMRRLLQKLVPDARILVGHGQMKERELEEVMEQFVTRRADVLLCTTIIESGLDIPSVNTIVINRADTFGMAQLYQLRGRVGRDRFQAHAYLLVSGAGSLTKQARERLEALAELSELGAGFKLAMRDLEIRGAGHLLGYRQSGQIAAVGFDMYCRLLEEVVQEAKGETVERREPEIIAPVAGTLPPSWIPAQAERLDIYRRIASAQAPVELRELGVELQNQYGEMPMRTLYLLQLGEIRLRARLCGIKSLHVRGKEAHMEIFPGDYELTAAFLDMPGMVFTDTHAFRASITGRWPEDFDFLVQVLDALEVCEVSEGELAAEEA